MSLDAKIPQGPLAEKWSKHKFNLKLVNPANKRKYDIISSWNWSWQVPQLRLHLLSLGYNVKGILLSG